MFPSCLEKPIAAKMMAHMFNNPLTSCKVGMCYERQDTRLLEDMDRKACPKAVKTFGEPRLKQLGCGTAALGPSRPPPYGRSKDVIYAGSIGPPSFLALRQERCCVVRFQPRVGVPLPYLEWAPIVANVRPDR